MANPKQVEANRANALLSTARRRPPPGDDRGRHAACHQWMEGTMSWYPFPPGPKPWMFSTCSTSSPLGSSQ